MGGRHPGRELICMAAPENMRSFLGNPRVVQILQRALAQDRLPHAGERNGLYYAMGYSGHGTQMSVHMGERMAAVMGGDALANPWQGRDWPALPGHFGPPWFLPALGLSYTLKDRLA